MRLPKLVNHGSSRTIWPEAWSTLSQSPTAFTETPTSRATSLLLSMLPDRAASTPDEPFEIAEARNVEDLSDIALEVGREVGGVELAAGEARDTPQLGELPADHEGEQGLRGSRRWPDGADLVAGQVLEIHHAAPAGQAVRDALHEHELLAPGEDEPAHGVPRLVDLGFQVPEQTGCVLHFVDHDGAGDGRAGTRRDCARPARRHWADRGTHSGGEERSCCTRNVLPD